MESFLVQLASIYTTERANTYTLTKTICHSSCYALQIPEEEDND